MQETDRFSWSLALTPLYQAISQESPGDLAYEAAKTLKERRVFLALVTYCRNMWPRLTNLLKHLKTYKWTPDCQRAFESVKSLVVTDTLLAYPDHHRSFDIETDASNFPLGAVIKQTSAQLLTTLGNSKEPNVTTQRSKRNSSASSKHSKHCSMLLGAQLIIYTDHQNLTHKLHSYTTQRVLRWCLLLEEYNPTFFDLNGPANVMITVAVVNNASNTFIAIHLLLEATAATSTILESQSRWPFKLRNNDNIKKNATNQQRPSSGSFTHKNQLQSNQSLHKDLDDQET